MSAPDFSAAIVEARAIILFYQDELANLEWIAECDARGDRATGDRLGRDMDRWEDHPEHVKDRFRNRARQALAGQEGQAVACERQLELLNRFRHAVAALPAIAERMATGQQFNEWERASNDEDGDPDDWEYMIGIGPVSDLFAFETVEGQRKADLIASALKLAAHALAHPAPVQPAGDVEMLIDKYAPPVWTHDMAAMPHDVIRQHFREFADDLLASLHLPVGPTHRHVKRGTEYVLLGYGKMQAEDWFDAYPTDDADSVDMREVAIYRSVDDGSLWVRPREEFEDGRFVSLNGDSGEKSYG